VIGRPPDKLVIPASFTGSTTGALMGERTMILPKSLSIFDLTSTETGWYADKGSVSDSGECFPEAHELTSDFKFTLKAIIEAVETGELPAVIHRTADKVNPHLTTVKKRDFDLWLSNQNQNQEASSTGKPCYLNPKYEYYSEEMATAVILWREFYEKGQYNPKIAHKPQLKEWLNANKSDLSDAAQDRIATLVNPNKKGGATPTE
jgi:hypothetical protein